MTRKFNLAVVGTNFIVPKFINAAEISGYFQLHSIVSRKMQTGIDFRNTNNYGEDVKIVNDIENLLNDDDVELIYIASPNSIHYEQAIKCIQACKPVIVEKPISSNVEELASLINLARENNTLLLDGMKSILCPNYKRLCDYLPKIGKIRQCTSTFSKISSRYQDYLDGKNPNTFNPVFSNGSAMDLGVYCIYPFIHLFDAPMEVHAHASLLDSGVDAAGTIILKYSDFHVTITHSKVSNTSNSTEIQGEEGTIIIENISTFSGLTLLDKSGRSTDISVPQEAESLVYIARHAGEAITSGLKESSVNTHALSLNAMGVLDDVRRQCGIRYPADKW